MSVKVKFEKLFNNQIYPDAEAEQVHDTNIKKHKMKRKPHQAGRNAKSETWAR